MIIFSLPRDYLAFLSRYGNARLRRLFSRFETRKDGLVGQLIRERGRWVRPFIHSGVIGLVFVGVTIGPNLVEDTIQAKNSEAIVHASSGGIGGGEILGVSTMSLSETVNTQDSEKPPADIVEYRIRPGDTVSTIADKFGVSADTVYWENGITEKTTLKPEETLRILPVTGVKHVVARGETVRSIADKYDVSAQAIVDWPYNTFVDDEKFTIAIGQTLIVPNGVKPNEPVVSPRRNLVRQTPDAGSVAASGSWMWPTAGRITQYFSWYHPAIDIANRENPPVAAADAGTVVLVSALKYGYGNHVIIDHGNGFQTLYAHLSAFRVVEGQKVNKGDVVGIMGSTGRSTGDHTHFEIRLNGVPVNPLSYLK